MQLDLSKLKSPQTHKTVGEYLSDFNFPKSHIQKTGGLSKLGREVCQLYKQRHGCAPDQSVRYYGKRPVLVNVYPVESLAIIQDAMTSCLFKSHPALQQEQD